MKRTLITGIAGFTGRYLTALLAERGHEVHGVVHHLPARPVAGASQVHVADLADGPALGAIVEAVQPDHVVHLAAIAFVGHDDIEDMYRSNVVGTRQLLDALARLQRRPASVIVASSANVYGNARSGTLDEAMSLSPVNDYGVTKVAAEYVARIYSSRLGVILVRPFNYTGRGQSENFLIPKIIAHARRRAPFIELGNLDVARDFSDVRSVAETYARLLDVPEAVGGTFNICSGRATTLGDLLDIVAELTGHRMEVRVNPALVRADEVKILVGSAAKLEGVAGKPVDIPLRDTLQWMLDE